MTSPNCQSSRLPRASVSSRSPTPTSSSSPHRLYSSPHRGSKTHLPQPKVLPFPDLPVRPTLSRDSSSNRLVSTLSTTSNTSANGSPSHGNESFTSSSPTSSSPSNQMMARTSSDGVGERERYFHVDSSPSIPSPLGLSAGTSAGMGVSSRNVTSHITQPSVSPTSVQAGPSSSSPTNIRTSSTISVSGIPTPARLQQGFQPQSIQTPTRAIIPPTATLPQPLPPNINDNNNNLVPLISLSTDRSSASSSAIHSTQVNLPSSSTATRERETKPLRPSTPVKKISLPPLSINDTMRSMTIVPPTSGQPLLDHLYQCFLKGVRADVRLWVRKWGIGWLVHSSVLIQTGESTFLSNSFRVQ